MGAANGRSSRGHGAEVMQGVPRGNGVQYSALTPNLQGLEAAIGAGLTEVAVFGAASEAFSQRNINCSIRESLERFRTVMQVALPVATLLYG